MPESDRRSYSEEFGRKHAERRREISELLKTIDDSEDPKEKQSAIAKVKELAAPVFREFSADLEGQAPSRAEATARLAAKFASIEDAKQASSLLLAANKYGVLRGATIHARVALGLSPAMGSGENELTGYADTVTTVLSEDVRPRDVRRLHGSGPPGPPIVAMLLAHEDKSVRNSAIVTLRRWGYWAKEATVDLVAVAKRDGGLAVYALEHVDYYAYREVKTELEKREK